MPPSARRQAIILPGVAEAIRTTENLVAKSVRSLTPADWGYFGPGSVSWRIFSHASYGVSGIAAALVQALHPTAMAAVDRHSAFRNDAWRRAHMTADYVLTITFSSRQVAEAAAKRVRLIHAGVRGTDPFSGRPYRADDPDLLLWIHAVHTEYALLGYERFGGRLAPGDADRFVGEQRAAAALVGLDPGAAPSTRAELRAFIASRAELRVTDAAAEFAGMLLGARMPLTMRPFWALHVVGAAALLPEPVFKAYSLPRRLPRGRFARLAVRSALRSINLGYLLFRPVREARAALRSAERAARARSAADRPARGK